MFPDDFLGVVALQACCAGIPAHHVARRIQLENGVLLYALNEQTEALFALVQGAFRPPLIRDILNDNSQEIVG